MFRGNSYFIVIFIYIFDNTWLFKFNVNVYPSTFEIDCLFWKVFVKVNPKHDLCISKPNYDLFVVGVLWSLKDQFPTCPEKFLFGIIWIVGSQDD